MTHSMQIAIIVAAAENDIIGRLGQMPWRMPSDLRHFRRLTLGKPVIIGRKTFQSIGGPLDGRDTIVVTRDPGFTADGVLVATSLEGAIALARACATARSSHELIIAGGGELYRLALPIADRIYLTRIHATPDGDATFPALDPNQWQEVTRAPLTTTPKDEFAAEVLVLQRHEKWA